MSQQENHKSVQGMSFGDVPVSPAPRIHDHGQDAHATLHIRHGAYLPHWTREGSTYFATFRLADSLPKDVLETWIFERNDIIKTAERLGRPLSEDEKKRLKALHSEKVERFLDAGHGECWMVRDDIASIVAGAVKHFEGNYYGLIAWCVMPNHVHALLRPTEEHDLPGILHSWKSFSAKASNRLLGRTGRFWQEEYYDHLVRDESDLHHCFHYILNNPRKAGLKQWKWVWPG